MIAIPGPALGEPAELKLYAAGSLRAVMTDIARDFTAAGGPPVTLTFGPSGLLRERIEKGEPVDVFASADVSSPQKLADARVASSPVVFARNQLCALVAPGVHATSADLLDRMLDSNVKLGTSTPKADPSGDYAWQVFEKAEKLRPGSFAALDRKALKLTGGPGSATAPADRSIYGMLVAERKADIFLTYCTNAVVAVREVPAATIVSLPESLATGASYGLVVARNARPEASALALYILSAPGQLALKAHGFTAVALP
jgi:ABC-type molybdate transport system substrate-binding protein